LAEGGLVDENHIRDLFGPLQGFELRRLLDRSAQMLEKRLMNNLVNQGAFPGTAHPGNGHETAERKGKIQIFEIVAGGAANLQPGVGFFRTGTAFFRQRD